MRAAVSARPRAPPAEDRVSLLHGGHVHVVDASKRQLGELPLDRSPSGSDAARVGYDAGEIEGASCARAACLPVPTSSGSPCYPSWTRAASTAMRAMAAATVLRIGTDSELLDDLVLMMMKTMNKEIKGTSESGALVMQWRRA